MTASAAPPASAASADLFRACFDAGVRLTIGPDRKLRAAPRERITPELRGRIEIEKEQALAELLLSETMEWERVVWTAEQRAAIWEGMPDDLRGHLTAHLVALAVWSAAKKARPDMTPVSCAAALRTVLRAAAIAVGAPDAINEPNGSYDPNPKEEGKESVGKKE